MPFDVILGSFSLNQRSVFLRPLDLSIGSSVYKGKLGERIITRYIIKPNATYDYSIPVRPFLYNPMKFLDTIPFYRA